MPTAAEQNYSAKSLHGHTADNASTIMSCISSIFMPASSGTGDHQTGGCQEHWQTVERSEYMLLAAARGFFKCVLSTVTVRICGTAQWIRLYMSMNTTTWRI